MREVREMTLRAIIIGVLGAVLVAGLGYVNDEVLTLNRLVGNHLPVSVFGGLIVFVLTINPLLWFVRRKWCFGGKELAVMVSDPLQPGQSGMAEASGAQLRPAMYAGLRG